MSVARQRGVVGAVLTSLGSELDQLEPSMSESSAATVPIQHHPTLYFPDGDVALLAKQRLSDLNGLPVDIMQIFRVHSFILKHHSPVFADMFGLPAPENLDADETHEGVPLVKLQDDGKDLASLLNALYNPSEIPYKRLDPNTPLLVGGILRLAHKYQIEPLRIRILEHFAADWPQNVDEWDRMEAGIAAVRRQHLGPSAIQGKLDGLYLDDRFPEPALAIKFAEEFQCPDVLVAAFIRVARASILNDDWNSERSGRTPWALRAGRQTVRWNLLTRSDLARVLRVREYLTGASVSDRTCMVFQVTGGSCEYSSGCPQVLQRLVMEHRRYTQESVDPFGALDECLVCASGSIPDSESTDSEGSQSLCEECTDCFKSFVRRRKLQMWEAVQDMIW